jgi:hypothetical protein
MIWKNSETLAGDGTVVDYVEPLPQNAYIRVRFLHREFDQEVP